MFVLEDRRVSQHLLDFCADECISGTPKLPFGSGPPEGICCWRETPEDWPVFTTLHRPTLARYVTSGLEDRGVSKEEIARQRDAKPDLLVAAEFDLDAPPALKPNGARRVMQRLGSDAEIAVDDDRHNYLAPHGGRRGMVEVMVREFGYAAAARYLDDSEEQVRQPYQHIEAAERADMATEALSKSDNRVRESSPDR
ncbi:hypothetical protein [Halolamina salifodinae]|uniref:Uncharacterized protein n=1 Tax=Halolamina salifodinae TaxID=1202767 RepID=A0A8T4GUS6_9EURY|nr:hypothetical protein [Halolamina salifodinae]MBP1986636.1 hypothetical protein [Halolamina salifodinae]